MGKIAPKYSSMKIEHYKALSENKELALEYQNYLGVCYGGEKDVGTKPHILCCDAARKEQKLTVNPWDKRQMEAVGYKRNGEIFIRTDKGLDTGLVEKMQKDLDEVKKIEFFEEKDIRKFTKQAAAIRKWSKKPQYQYGFCLCANIFLGLRAGEILALKWKDVDFASRKVYVHENLQLVNNPGKKPAQVYETQSLKNYQNRTVRMNNSAKHFLELQKKYSGYTAPDDYVCCTRDGNHAAVSYLSSNIKEIEKAAGTKVQAYGTHIIRHTCASLYFRKGVRTELIAALLGHSVDVCRKTYIHFEEEQKKDAVKLIDDYEIDYKF